LLDGLDVEWWEASPELPLVRGVRDRVRRVVGRRDRSMSLLSPLPLRFLAEEEDEDRDCRAASPLPLLSSLSLWRCSLDDDVFLLASPDSPLRLFSLRERCFDEGGAGEGDESWCLLDAELLVLPRRLDVAQVEGVLDRSRPSLPSRRCEELLLVVL
jgi:hypothetical protein